MKQTIFYLNPVEPEGGQQAFLRASGLGAIRDARARNVKAFFGLWLGLFAFTVVWAIIDLLQHGVGAMPERVWAQLVVLAAAVIFYLGTKPLRHTSAVGRFSTLPVSLSIVACLMTFGSLVVQADLRGDQTAKGFLAALEQAGLRPAEIDAADPAQPPLLESEGITQISSDLAA